MRNQLEESQSHIDGIRRPQALSVWLPSLPREEDWVMDKEEVLSGTKEISYLIHSRKNEFSDFN